MIWGVNASCLKIMQSHFSSFSYLSNSWSHVKRALAQVLPRAQNQRAAQSTVFMMTSRAPSPRSWEGSWSVVLLSKVATALCPNFYIRSQLAHRHTHPFAGCVFRVDSCVLLARRAVVDEKERSTIDIVGPIKEKSNTKHLRIWSCWKLLYSELMKFAFMTLLVQCE